MLSERVLARWWRLVAFLKATNLLHWVMRAVSYRCIATAIEMTIKGGGHFAHRCVDCHPGGRRGDTERVVARWRRLVAFMKALDHLHQAMCAVSHHRTAMAIEMAWKKHVRNLFWGNGTENTARRVSSRQCEQKKHDLLCKMSPASHFFLFEKGEQIYK
jgi:hypothetical protein